MSDPTALVMPRDLPSPNHDARPAGVAVDMLVLHATGARAAPEALGRACDPATRASAHYVVDGDGTVWRLVAEQHRAWHAGQGWWRGRAGVDDRSVGIMVVGPGGGWGPRAFPALQMAALCDLCLGVLSRHPIPARNVVARGDVIQGDVIQGDAIRDDAMRGDAIRGGGAPDGGDGAAEMFDWHGLAAGGVGL